MIFGLEKKYLVVLMVIITTLSCKAQNIVPIYEGPEELPPLPRYYKDVDNDFNAYEGEWKWEEGNSSLTIVFEKKEMVEESNGNVFQDFLIGAYIYVENGNELVNSFPLQINPQNIRDNFISGWNITTFYKSYFPPCSECDGNERYIKLNITDPNRLGLWGRLCVIHFTENGVEKIRMRIWNTDWDPLMIPPGYTGPSEITIPEGIYTLIKQD